MAPPPPGDHPRRFVLALPPDVGSYKIRFPVTPDITQYLPHRPPFLFVDAIVAETDTALTARLRVRPDFDFFRGHYPGEPIMPGVLIAEAVFQAGSILLSKIQQRETGGGAAPKGVPVLARIENARFRSVVRPGDELTIDVKVKERMAGFCFMTGSVKAGTRRVMHVDFCVTQGGGERAG